MTRAAHPPEVPIVLLPLTDRVTPGRQAAVEAAKREAKANAVIKARAALEAEARARAAAEGEAHARARVEGGGR